MQEGLLMNYQVFNRQVRDVFRRRQWTYDAAVEGHHSRTAIVQMAEDLGGDWTKLTHQALTSRYCGRLRSPYPSMWLGKLVFVWDGFVASLGPPGGVDVHASYGHHEDEAPQLYFCRILVKTDPFRGDRPLVTD
jgi:hypothetical protein